MRTFKYGDIVSVSADEIAAALKYVPNAPEEITNTNGRITSVWRLTSTPEGFMTVQLDICPKIPNLQFELKDVTLLIPVELDQRLTAIENKLAKLTRDGQRAV